MDEREAERQVEEREEGWEANRRALEGEKKGEEGEAIEESRERPIEEARRMSLKRGISSYFP